MHEKRKGHFVGPIVFKLQRIAENNIINNVCFIGDSNYPLFYLVFQYLISFTNWNVKKCGAVPESLKYGLPLQWYPLFHAAVWNMDCVHEAHKTTQISFISFIPAEYIKIASDFHVRPFKKLFSISRTDTVKDIASIAL